MSLLRQMRGGKDYDTRFGHRMKGEGPLAQLLSKRFALAKKKLGMEVPLPPLDCSRFRPPSPDGQMTLL
jgi:hypothetical protein